MAKSHCSLITNINLKFLIMKKTKDSNKKCNGLFLTPPQGKAARRGG